MSRLGWFLVVVALLFGAGALTLGTYYSTNARYEVEFGPELVLLAVVGILVVERVLAGWPMWRWVARLGWGLLLTFSVVFNLCASAARAADTHYSFGFALMQKGKLDEAIAQFRKALKIQPRDEMTQSNLGIALYRKGQYDEAIVLFQKAMEIQPLFPEVEDRVGLALQQKGQLDDAMAHFRKAVQMQPNYDEAHNDLGAALLRKGQVNEAMGEFQKAVDFQPNLSEAHNNLGDLMIQKGRVDEAISLYEKALRLKPDYADASNNLAVALGSKQIPANPPVTPTRP